MGRQRLGKAYLAHLRHHSDKQDAHPHPKQGAGLRAGERYQPQARQGNENAHNIERTKLFLETHHARHHGQDGVGGNDQRRNGRRLREFQAVGLCHKVNEGHAQGQEHELEQVPAALDAHGNACYFVQYPQQHPGQEGPYRDKEFYGDIQRQQTVGPDVGHGPQAHREHGGRIRTNREVSHSSCYA